MLRDSYTCFNDYVLQYCWAIIRDYTKTSAEAEVQKITREIGVIIAMRSIMSEYIIRRTKTSGSFALLEQKIAHSSNGVDLQARVNWIFLSTFAPTIHP